MNNFEDALNAFVTDSQKKIDTEMQDLYKEVPDHARKRLILKAGRKYIKIICVVGSTTKTDGYVWAFIDKETGLVYKPASWAAPAKHARADIFKSESWATVDAYGPAYLR